MKYLTDPFVKMFDFNGKSSVKEFWIFILFQYIIIFILGIVGAMIDFRFLGKLYIIISLIPFIALGFRRLKDAGFNQWLFLIPIANIILASIPKKEG